MTHSFPTLRSSDLCSSPEKAKRAPVPGWVPGEPGVTGDAGPAAEAAGGISKCRCVRRITRIERSTADARPLGQFDLYVHTRSEIELHQRIDRLRRRLHNVEHALVGADLELLARLLVDVHIGSASGRERVCQ